MLELTGGASGADAGDVHVVYRPREPVWAVQVERQYRAASLHETKSEAEDAGRTRAKRDRSELFVHGKDGKIQNRSATRPPTD